MLVLFTVLLWRKKKNVYKITMQNRQMEIILLAWKKIEVWFYQQEICPLEENKRLVQMCFPSLLLLQVGKEMAWLFLFYFYKTR